MMNEETVIRDGQEPHMRREQGLSPSEPSAKGASAHSRHGILIFSRRRQLLHMNRCRIGADRAVLCRHACEERSYQATRHEIAGDATVDGPMNISFANRP